MPPKFPPLATVQSWPSTKLSSYLKTTLPPFLYTPLKKYKIDGATFIAWGYVENWSENYQLPLGLAVTLEAIVVEMGGPTNQAIEGLVPPRAVLWVGNEEVLDDEDLEVQRRFERIRNLW